MNENELISKKELLQLTGISYGQLYRWKRENLIPEEWFIKRSSFTGQETFFPKDKILKRTEMILELKDKYSLEELANILTPESTNRTIGKNILLKLEGMDVEIVEMLSITLKKDYFNFIEFIFINVLIRLNEEFKMEKEELVNIAGSVLRWLPTVRNTTFRFVLCRKDSKVISLLVQHDAVVLFDTGTEELKSIYLDELAKELNLKFNEALEGF